MKRRVQLIALALFSITLLAGCSQKEGLEVSGSTSIAPVMQKIITSYKDDTNTQVNINADGSSAGIKAAASGISNIGMASRELEKEEDSLGLDHHVIAYDAIAVVVNKQNKVDNLNRKQLRDIFSGKIRNWKHVGGIDLPIVVVSREDGSGTRTAFEETLGLLNENKSSKINDSMPLIVNSTGGTLENVLQKEGAIGFVSYGSINDDVNLVSLDGVKPNRETVKNKDYLLSRNFNIVAKNPDQKTKDFIEYILSDKGQKIISEEGFISIK